MSDGYLGVDIGSISTKAAVIDDAGDVRLDAYEAMLSSRVKLVAFTQVSNALGTLVPVVPMVEMAHRHGARVLVDGAQAAPHMRIDVQALGCDFYAFSAHKMYGPTGIGALYGRAAAESPMALRKWPMLLSEVQCTDGSSAMQVFGPKISRPWTMSERCRSRQKRS